MGFIKPSNVVGTMELLPNEQILFDNVKNIIEDTFKKRGFLPIDTPVFEKNEILLAKGGGETTKQIFKIDSESKDISLRFDLTVPLARYVAQYFSDLNFPFRRYHIGKVYRGERNQKGRYKEFYQCDIDVIGNGKLDIKNDAELPYIIYEIFSEIINRGQGSAQPNVSAKDIMTIPCVMPESSVINQFNRKLSPMFEMITNNQFENLKLSKLKNTLLPKLISGEIDVSNIDL